MHSLSRDQTLRPSALVFLLFQCESADRGLAKADTAIIGRNSVIDPDTQMAPMRKFGKICHEKFVLKYSSRENDGVEAMLLTKLLRSIEEAGCNPMLKSAGDF